MGFSLRIDQDPYLGVGKTDLYALLSVTHAEPDGAGAPGGPAAGQQMAEVILIDCSSSMDWPPTKIHAARQATRAAIDALRDGTRFAVVAGAEDAHMVYPTKPELAVAGTATRAAAHAAVSGLIACGGTAIGRWLSMAHQLLAAHPTAIRHVTLLTDGQNSTSDEQELRQVLEGCRDVLQCDARGIGEDWSARQLIGIAEALRGTADAVPRESELAEEFRRIIDDTMRRTVPELRVRIDLSRFAEFRFLRQQYPAKMDLGDHVTRVDDRTIEISTGAWGDESREYLLCLGVGAAGPPGEEIRAARIDLLVAAEPQGTPEPVRLHRTDVADLSQLHRSELDQSRDELALQLAVEDGCDAYADGDRDRMLASWTRAVVLARKLGDERMYGLLSVVLHIDDGGTGRIRLRDDIARGNVLALETGSRLTGRFPARAAPAPTVAPAPTMTCECGEVSAGDAVFCEECGRRFVP